MQRHQNRELLLQRLSDVRLQMRALEREIVDIEQTVRDLPYEVRGTSAAVPARPVYSPLANAFAGGVALPLAIGIMHPLDTVRTAMQAALQGDKGFLQITQNLGFRGFLRGVGTSILWASPQGAIRLCCYESCKENLNEIFDMKPLSVGISAIAGDLASSCIKVPRELVTQRMQTGQYRSGWAAAQKILQEDGAKGFFRGYASTCARDAPFMVLLFLSFEQFKAWKVRLAFANSGPSQLFSPWSDMETVLWGGISGAIAGFLTTPFDVVKTRVMTSQVPLSMGEAVRSIGPLGLFTGAGPRSAWWFCVSSIFFSSFGRLRIPAQGFLDNRGF